MQQWIPLTQCFPTVATYWGKLFRYVLVQPRPLQTLILIHNAVKYSANPMLPVLATIYLLR